jgi:hypothetical protein
MNCPKCQAPLIKSEYNYRCDQKDHYFYLQKNLTNFYLLYNYQLSIGCDGIQYYIKLFNNGLCDRFIILNSFPWQDCNIQYQKFLQIKSFL